MQRRWYSLASMGAVAAIAGCGSSSKTTVSSGASQAASPTPSNASAVSPVAGGGHEGTPGLTLHRSEFGRVIFATNNRVLYTFGADHGTTSTCYGVCASAWPPLLSKNAPSIGAGLKRGLLGTTKRNDGSIQVTYGGHPLYYYSGDAPGKIMCQAANMHGGFWYVVNADGSANKAKGHGMMMMGHEKMKAHKKM
jgi:predicted lipoprotein with Yx(FWY)xxD motif